MRDYKLDRLDIDPAYRELGKNLRNTEFNAIAFAFIQNIGRIDSFVRMPFGLFYRGSVFGQNLVLAYQQLKGEPYDFSKCFQPTEEEAVQLHSIMQSLTLPLFESLNNNPQERSRVTRETYHEIVTIGPSIHEELTNSFEAILSAAVIGTWTAFETLAGDLWEKAINVCPNGLAELKGTKHRINKASSGCEPENDSGLQEEYKKQNAAKNVKMDLIHKFTRGTYDLRDSVGSLLRTNLDFQSLRKIRTAYSMAFHEDAHPDAIDKALSDSALDGLSISRNVLVHKSGIADDEYVSKSNRCAILPVLETGNRLELDGDLVRKIVAPAIAITCDLFDAVDNLVARKS